LPFYGCEFTFNGVCCSNFDLIIYDISSTQENGSFSSVPSNIFETKTATRYNSIYYGVSKNSSLRFTVTFGINATRLDLNSFLSRSEMQKISEWLTGVSGYGVLSVNQQDMGNFSYRCMVTRLDYITYGKMPFAFECEFTCDSPYAYMTPTTEIISSESEASQNIVCDASCEFYYPKMKIELSGNSAAHEFSIKNITDNNRVFSLTNIPSSVHEISVDNDNQVISNDAGLNIYNNFNFHFFRLVRGENQVSVIGEATVTFYLEFPVDIGG